MHALVACVNSKDTQQWIDTNVRVILIHISNKTIVSWQAFNAGNFFDVSKTHGVRVSLEYLDLLWKGIQAIIFGIGEIGRLEYDVLEISSTYYLPACKSFWHRINVKALTPFWYSPSHVYKKSHQVEKVALGWYVLRGSESKWKKSFNG